MNMIVLILVIYSKLSTTARLWLVRELKVVNFRLST